MVIPIFILSFFYFKNPNSSKSKKFIVFIIAIFSCYIGIISNSRVFQLLLLLILLDFLFSKRIFLKIIALLIVISSLAMIYQENILKTYNQTYKEKLNQTYQYITNDEPFRYYGYKDLMVISDPSNRERLHYLKLSYRTATNNLFFGYGSNQIRQKSNLHGNIFVYFTSFGLINLFFIIFLVMNLFITIKKNLKTFSSHSDLMRYYYLLYAIICLFFVSAGNFPMLPFIIAAAVINANNKLKIT